MRGGKLSLSIVIFTIAVILASASACTAAADEFRAFWVTGWSKGFLSQSEVDTLLGVPGDATKKGTIRNANCNAVVVQVRRSADVCYPSGMGEPYFSLLSPSNFNALQAIINAAHDTTGGKQRIEVHAWIVVFRTDGNSVYGAHHSTPTGSLIDLDNYWPTRLSTGAENSGKAFDPGHPLAQEYLVNVCMDLVNNFDIDGIHYDYIRFNANNEGFNPTSVARYNAKYGLTGEPLSTDEQFKQWRRDQVTAFVRKVYAKIQSSKPWVKQTAAVVTWSPSPSSSTRSAFQATRPYYDVYSDWDAWMQEGILDMVIPMNYYDQAVSYAYQYIDWMNFMKDRKFSRHAAVGPGIYKNSLQNAIDQLLMTRNPSPAGNYGQGFCGYSYQSPFTYGGTSYGPWGEFAPQLISQVTPTPANIPPMPWKTAPAKGHISGTVTYAANGKWADGATVTITGPVNRTLTCDGTGFYAFIDIPPGTYTVTASKTGYPGAQKSVTVTIGQVTGNMYVTDLVLGGVNAPVISNVTASNILTNSALISWTTDQASSSKVEYGLTTSYGSATPVADSQVTSHSMTLTGLAQNTLYHFRVISANTNGTSTSTDYTFTTPETTLEVIIDNTDSGWSNTSPGSNTWTAGTAAGVPRIGTNYLYYKGDGSTTESSVTRRCRWTPNLSSSGYYDVYVYYQLGTNRNSAAPYKVYYNGGNVTSVQNQYSSIANQGGWFLIGSNLPFTAGSSGYVELTTLSTDTNLVSADAAKWVYKGPLTLPVVGLSSEYLFDSIIGAAASRFEFMTWGTVSFINANEFDLLNPGQTPVWVRCVAHGMSTGDFISVRGMWTYNGTPRPYLTCQPNNVKKFIR